MNTRPGNDGDRLEATAAAQPAAANRSSIDQPLNAIVYDAHPAMASRSAGLTGAGGDYPYALFASRQAELPPPTSAPPQGVLAPLLHWADGAAAWLGKVRDQYLAAISRPADFVVPKTFGMSAILGMMTTLAFIFAFLRWLDAYPVFFFFFAVEALGICLAQMLYGQAPRLASIVMGAVILPGFTLVALLFAPVGPQDVPATLCLLIGFVPFGALLGYLTGTCAAGTFLVMEYLEPYLHGRRWHWGGRL